MYCHECGTNLSQESIFCTNCGTKSANTHQEVSSDIKQNNAESTTETEKVRIVENHGNNNSKQNLNGIGGWLAFLGFGLFVSPLAIGFSILQMIPLVTNPETSQNLSSLGALDNMNLQIFLMVILLGINIYCLYLFTKKQHKFIKYFQGFMLFAIFVYFMDFGVAMTISDDPSNSESLIKVIVSSIVWISYIHNSKRVKNTFIN